MASKCLKCQKFVNNKEYLKCQKCKNIYHVDCTSRFKLYDLMTPETKKTWTCITCCRQTLNTSSEVKMSHTTYKTTYSQKVTVQNKPRNKTMDGSSTIISKKKNRSAEKPEPNSSIPMEKNKTTITTPPSTTVIASKNYIIDYRSPTEIKSDRGLFRPEITNSEEKNITHRNKVRVNATIGNSFDSLSSEFENSIDDRWQGDIGRRRAGLYRSCPEITKQHCLDCETLQQKFSNLQQKYASAEEEIETLSAEIYTLKKELQKYELKINKLKNICASTESTPNTKQSTKQIRKVAERRQTKTDYQISLDFTHNENKTPRKAQTNSLDHNVQYVKKGIEANPHHADLATS